MSEEKPEAFSPEEIREAMMLEIVKEEERAHNLERRRQELEPLVAGMSIFKAEIWINVSKEQGADYRKIGCLKNEWRQSFMQSLASSGLSAEDKMEKMDDEERAERQRAIERLEESAPYEIIAFPVRNNVA